MPRNAADLFLDHGPKLRDIADASLDVENAKAVLVQAINLFWEMEERDNPAVARAKSAAIALFLEENGLHADPYTIVCRSDPPQLARGHCVLAFEMVPAWVLYIRRAYDLLDIVEKATSRDYSG